MAVANLSPVPDLLLIDGRFTIGSVVDQRPVVKGDALSMSVAAASIVAKVTRDHLMERYDLDFPQFGFTAHKGYPTPRPPRRPGRPRPLCHPPPQLPRYRDRTGARPVTVARQRLGRHGEALAAAYLRLRGYRIVATNYRTRLGEIDIIARDGATLVFVEVKVRRNPRFGSAKAAVTAAKQRRLSMVALQYLKTEAGAAPPARFDVVAVDQTGGQPRLELVQNAFEVAYP